VPLWNHEAEAESSTKPVSISNGMLLHNYSRDGLSDILGEMFGCTRYIELIDLSNVTHSYPIQTLVLARYCSLMYALDKNRKYHHSLVLVTEEMHRQIKTKKNRKVHRDPKITHRQSTTNLWSSPKVIFNGF
jgi:hypothetical protein